jgi:hypothetical protein
MKAKSNTVWNRCLIMALALLAVVCVPSICLCQAQRMGISIGRYILPAGGSKRVNAYCLDYTRHSPTVQTSYSQVLTSPEGATVTIGSRKMSLQQAISQKLVEVKGSSISFGQFLQLANDPMVIGRLPQADQTLFKQMLQEYKGLSPSERRIVESQMAPLVAAYGDHTSLRLVNKTKQDLSVDVSQNSVFGERREHLHNIEAASIATATSNLPQEEIQGRIWHDQNVRLQTKLRDVGYYDGEIDGKAGQRTTAAILAFQKDHFLRPDAIVGAETAEHLTRATEAAGRVRQVNEASGGRLAAFWLDSHVAPERDALYGLYSDSGKPVFVGNDIGELARSMSRKIGTGTPDTIYVFVDDTSINRAEAFGRSARAQLEHIRPDSSLKVVPVKEGDKGLFEFFFSARAHIDRTSFSEPVLVVDGARKGMYTSNFEVSCESGRARMSIFARTRELLRQFIQAVRDILQTDLSRMSPARVINQARARIIRINGATEQDLIMRFRDEVGNSHIVELMTRNTLNVG